MTEEELKKLYNDLAESYRRFEKAIKSWIENPNTDNLEQLKKADEECKSLNKRFWDWINE